MAEAKAPTARRMSKKKVLATARPLVHQLAKCFCCPCPVVHAYSCIEDEKFVAGRYYGGQNPEIALRVRRFTTPTVLHEFAHHLQCLEYKDGLLPDNSDVHGQEFFKQLLLVTSHYYGDPEHYDWVTGEVACPQTVKRFQQSNEMPPLVSLLKEGYPQAFENYVRSRQRAMVPCRLCNPEAKACAAGASR